MKEEKAALGKKGKISRVVIIILDSVGIGELPDAHKYYDEGSNTLKNTADIVGGLYLPNLSQLGLGNIIEVKGVSPVAQPLAAYGRMIERSAGKDTTTGHWELMGLYLPKPFPTYPKGFPREIMDSFEKKIQRKVLGNKAASGTEIIKELGEEHLKTGYPIVYTSADSVFQIAAHEDVIPCIKLYEMCEMAWKILNGKKLIGRVIARPFIGKPGHFERTERRKDFSIAPPEKTILDYALENEVEVVGIGKIGEIFNFRGISITVHTKNNMDGVSQTVNFMKKVPSGIIFANLVDFDMLWGHRNDPHGYAQGLEDADKRLPEILGLLKEDDVLVITADHGCDPTTPSTDHSREYVPLLVYGKRIKPISLGTRKTFADVGKSIAHFLDFEVPTQGESFAAEILGLWHEGL